MITEPNDEYPTLMQAGGSSLYFRLNFD